MATTQQLDEVANQPAAPARIARSVVDDVDRYSSSVSGIELEAVRAGAGDDPTEVIATTNDRFTFTSSTIGFPMLSRSTLRDDMVCIAYMRRTTPGSLWCEMSLEPGAVIAYARAAEHTARNLAGMRFIFVVTDQVQYEEHADLLGIRFAPPPQGEVQLVGTAKNNLIGKAFETFADCAASGKIPPSHLADDVMRAATRALSPDRHARRIGSRRAIDKRHVVIDCPPSVEAPQTLTALRLVDVALIPVQPSPLDIWATVHIEREVEAAREQNPGLRRDRVAGGGLGGGADEPADGHAGLHAAGAGPRRADGPPDRYLVVWCGIV